MIQLLICGDVERQPGPQSLSRVHFQKFMSRKGMKIVYQNIRGLGCNFDMLQEFVESHDKIDINVIEGKHYIYRRRVDLEGSLSECLWIEIFVKRSKSFLIGCFYRPPRTLKYLAKNYNDQLQEHLNTIVKENTETIIVGDFNITYNDPSDNTEFKSAINQHGLKQMVYKSTRITSTSSTLIDLIITNKPSSLSHVHVI